MNQVQAAGQWIPPTKTAGAGSQRDQREPRVLESETTELMARLDDLHRQISMLNEHCSELMRPEETTGIDQIPGAVAVAPPGRRAMSTIGMAIREAQQRVLAATSALIALRERIEA